VLFIVKMKFVLEVCGMTVMCLVILIKESKYVLCIRCMYVQAVLFLLYLNFRASQVYNM